MIRKMIRMRESCMIHSLISELSILSPLRGKVGFSLFPLKSNESNNELTQIR
jgi:hypothetical protein